MCFKAIPKLKRKKKLRNKTQTIEAQKINLFITLKVISNKLLHPETD